MEYDLVIRNGTVIDGSGMPRFRADVGVAGGKIAVIGKVRDRAREVIDAEGHVVAPGIIDGHTHMDAQVFWDALGTSSCWHGVTSVVMGNCGFSLAPCAEKDKHLVMRNLERAEDISREAMEAGIRWSWSTFAQYLDAVDRAPKGINYAAYMGHSALRTFVMGERAFSEEATEADLQLMKGEVRDAIRAGAIGFTTSRSSTHETADRRPVASRIANWDEVRQLVGVMGELNAGVFEIAGEQTGADPERTRDYLGRLKALAVETGVPVTFGQFAHRRYPDDWRQYIATAEETAQAGGRMFVQVHSRPVNAVHSFETNLPFDRLPIWRDIRKLPLAEQQAALRDPDTRRKLVEIAQQERRENAPREGQLFAAGPDFRWLWVADRPLPPYRSVAEIAAELQPGSGRSDNRPGAQEGPQAVLLPDYRQRKPGPCTGDDAPSAMRSDVLRFGRPRVAVDGLVVAKSRAELLGAGSPGADAGAGNPDADLHSGFSLGPGGPRAPARRLGRRHHDLRSRHDRPGVAGAGA